MSSKIMYLFTRTPLHVGAGSSVGAIDMPIQRERHTQTPIIPGSSMKGVLRNLWPKAEKTECERIFGPESDSGEHRAGELLVGEARALCFPVRSAKGSFAWLTSPLALARYAREVGKTISLDKKINDDECLAGKNVFMENADKSKKSVVLEEYCFTMIDNIPDAITGMLSPIMQDDALWQSVAERLVIVSDGIFSHFCATACEVQQRIKIDTETGTVAPGALFNQENVPSETMFYAMIGERRAESNACGPLAEKLGQVNNILQIGGDETIGLGFCSAVVR